MTKPTKRQMEVLEAMARGESLDVVCYRGQKGPHEPFYVIRYVQAGKGVSQDTIRPLRRLGWIASPYRDSTYGEAIGPLELTDAGRAAISSE